MIVVMKSGANREQVEHVAKLVREMGLKDHVIVGTERTVVAVIGDDRFKDRSVLESVEGVDKVVPILAPYKMASREVKKERSVVPLLSTTPKPGQAVPTVGGTRVAVMAGPCSVESRQQTLEIAHAVKEAGAVALRGGAFKPRTSPYAFQGLAEEGLVRISVGPLGLDALQRILQAEIGEPVPRPAAAHLADMSGGNPYFALELARAALREAGSAALTAEIPLPEGLYAVLEDLMNHESFTDHCLTDFQRTETGIRVKGKSGGGWMEITPVESTPMAPL